MMNGFKAVLTAMLLAMLVACGGGEEAFEPRQLTLEQVFENWKITELQETYVVRTEQEWSRVWLLHEPQGSPIRTRPAVDFSTKMVLGVTQGTGPSGCDSLRIQTVVEKRDELVVQYRVSDITQLPPDVGCTGAVVPLTGFVVVDRIDKPVFFNKIAA